MQNFVGQLLLSEAEKRELFSDEFFTKFNIFQKKEKHDGVFLLGVREISELEEIIVNDIRIKEGYPIDISS
jgi:hypothetical protein